MKQDTTSHRPMPYLRLIAAGMLLLGTSQSQAALIGVDAGIPDLQATSLSIDYDSTGGSGYNVLIYNSSATSLSYFDGTAMTSPGAGFLDFQVTFSSPGVLDTGTVQVCDGGSGTSCAGDIIVGGTLMSFGYEFASGSPNSAVAIDGTYSINTSNSTSYPFMLGETGNFIFTLSGLPAGVSDWSTSFDAGNSIAGVGPGDVTGPAQAPVPSTLTLMAFALLGAYRLRRR